MGIFKEEEKIEDHDIKYIKIDEVTEEELNPKDHDIEEIIKSIHRFGFIEPLIVNETTGKLVSGHGRLESIKTIKDRGYETPDGIREENGEWLIPVVSNIKFKNDAEARAYLIATNRLVELGGWNNDKLSDMLSELKESSNLLLEGVGFTELEMDKLKNKNEVVEPEVDFVTEPLEANNYVMFSFNNVMDWAVVSEHLNLETKDALDSKEGYRRRGLGRVVDGKVLLEILNEKD